MAVVSIYAVQSVSFMECAIQSKIFLLLSSGRSLSSIIHKRCVKTSFEGSPSPNTCTNARTLAKRSSLNIKRRTEQQKMSTIRKTIVCKAHGVSSISKICLNRPFSYSTKEPGSSDIFVQFYTRGSTEWR